MDINITTDLKVTEHSRTRMIRKKNLYSKFEIDSDRFFQLRNFGVSTVTAYYLAHPSNFHKTAKLIEYKREIHNSYWLTVHHLSILRQVK